MLHDASGQSSFSADDYVREHRARSVLCLPILKQTRLLGTLYLENNLTVHAFTPARIAILKLLASEAAISLENARLYRDLASAKAESGDWSMPISLGSSFATRRSRFMRPMTRFFVS